MNIITGISVEEQQRKAKLILETQIIPRELEFQKEERMELSTVLTCTKACIMMLKKVKSKQTSYQFIKFL